MFTREFWRDTKRHDEIWAVEMCSGHVSRCCGPFNEGEVDEELLTRSTTRLPEQPGSPSGVTVS